MKVIVALPLGPPHDYSRIVEAGHELVFGREYGERRGYAAGELEQLVRDADVLISGSAERALMESGERLRAVVGPYIGYERIDIVAATELGIVACNSPSRENATGVSEAAIGQMLALGKRLKHKESLLRGGGWGTDADRGFLVSGKTIGIVGLGRTGFGVAQRLQGWECRLIAYDPYISAEKAGSLGVELVDDLPALLRVSDYVTLHVVVTEETTNMIDERALRQMKPTAYLVNTSRGRAVDEAALCRAIDEGWIAGAALDVFWEEPLPMSSPLRELDPSKVILTPHKIALSPDSREGNIRLAVQSTLDVLVGKMPEHTLNPEVIPIWKSRFEV